MASEAETLDHEEPMETSDPEQRESRLSPHVRGARAGASMDADDEDGEPSPRRHVEFRKPQTGMPGSGAASTADDEQQDGDHAMGGADPEQQASSIVFVCL